MSARSYWQSMVAEGPRAHEAIKSWLSPLCDDLTPYEADILCDWHTDEERGKLRVYASDADGVCYLLTRTRTKQGHTVNMKKLGKVRKP